MEKEDNNQLDKLNNIILNNKDIIIYNNYIIKYNFNFKVKLIKSIEVAITIIDTHQHIKQAYINHNHYIII